MPSSCNRVSAFSSRLFVMPTWTSNILSYPRCSAFAASARADHCVWLKRFHCLESTVTETKFSNDVLTHWRMRIFSSRTQFADSLLARLSEWPKHGTKCATEQSRLSNAWAPSYFPAILLALSYDCTHFLISIPACWRNELSDSSECSQSASYNKNNMSEKIYSNFCIKHIHFRRHHGPPGAAGPEAAASLASIKVSHWAPACSI